MPTPSPTRHDVQRAWMTILMRIPKSRRLTLASEVQVIQQVMKLDPIPLDNDLRGKHWATQRKLAARYQVTIRGGGTSSMSLDDVVALTTLSPHVLKTKLHRSHGTLQLILANQQIVTIRDAQRSQKANL